MDPAARRPSRARCGRAHAHRHTVGATLTTARSPPSMTYKTGTDLVNEAKQRIREVSPQEVLAMQERNADVVYLDVREPNEWNLGHLPNAVHLPRGNLESNIEARVERHQTIVIHCARGNRSGLAADPL